MEAFGDFSTAEKIMRGEQNGSQRCRARLKYVSMRKEGKSRTQRHMEYAFSFQSLLISEPAARAISASGGMYL
jgi:hypothetical protein